ncbi:uncharacterized protein BO97DRAFT_47255 [Aspergillus homomorphus CBS 101889]|uniref:Uncharacterized protein n=1 Tax=Aspergillus homomorphus (strain CBS 101889) TaxID=1450537 RepID=A0A395HZQ0_ASPHC|nr:hypothetical protein BO97DRAFT_47255 [Aspergillus homomorphus CBS 101889]RAL12863.1 hypothetical protein BO97DRAFT_47255 [Aspergillus homomorphus CBS 101889]
MSNSRIYFHSGLDSRYTSPEYSPITGIASIASIFGGVFYSRILDEDFLFDTCSSAILRSGALKSAELA